MQYLLQVGLVDPEPQLSILETLPPSSKRAIALEACAALSNVSLSTSAHVKWYLESIGAAFTLPLDDIEAMEAATKQYCQWLNAETRPAGIVDFGEDLFDECLFRLLAALFVPRRADTRSQTTGALQKHINLCKEALSAMQQFTRRSVISTDLSIKTARIILGICDSLLSFSSLPFCYLVEELSDDLLRLCWTALLTFEDADQKSWQFLRVAFNRWTHRPQVIGHWQSAALGSSESIMHRLYQADSNAEQPITLQYAQDSITIHKESFLAFAWDQIVELLPRPGKLSAANFCRAVIAVDKVVSALTMCSPETVSLQGQHAPDANSVLGLFGEWLFEAITTGPKADDSVDRSAESEGRAIAIGILCRIFSQPRTGSHSPILPTYLERFYASLHHACCMETDDLFPLVMIMISSEELFASDLAGIRVLMGSIVYGIRRLLPSTDQDLARLLGTNVRVDFGDLRRSCYKILATIFSSLNHFDQVTLPPSLLHSFPVSPLSRHKSYSDAVRKIFLEEAAPSPFNSLKAAIWETAIESALVEQETGNVQYMLNCLCMFVFDCAQSDPEVVGLVIRLIAEQMELARWSFKECPAALMTLGQLAKLQPIVSLQNRERPKNLVLSLCRFGETCLSAGTATYRNLLPALIDTILLWCLEGSWLDGDQECQQQVLSLLADCSSSSFIPVDNKRDSFSDFVQGNAESAIEIFCLRFAINRCSVNYPRTISSSIIDEPSLAYAIVPRHVSLVANDGNDAAIMSVITPVGQYEFKHRPYSKGPQSSHVPEKEHYEFEENPSWEYPTEMDIFTSTPSYNAVYEAVSVGQEKLLDRLAELKKAMDVANESVIISRPHREIPSPQSYQNLPLLFRGNQFVSSFAAKTLPPKAKCLAAAKSSAKSIRDKVEVVQEISERNSLTGSLVFVRSGRQSCREIIEEQPITADFAGFCKSLGLVPLDQTAYICIVGGT